MFISIQIYIFFGWVSVDFYGVILCSFEKARNWSIVVSCLSLFCRELKLIFQKRYQCCEYGEERMKLIDSLGFKDVYSSGTRILFGY